MVAFLLFLPVKNLSFVSYREIRQLLVNALTPNRRVRATNFAAVTSSCPEKQDAFTRTVSLCQSPPNCLTYNGKANLSGYLGVGKRKGGGGAKERVSILQQNPSISLSVVEDTQGDA